MLLFGGLVASKIFTAYSVAALADGIGVGGFANTAAFYGESILSVAWGAVRDVGLSFVDAISSIDGLSKFVNSGFTYIKNMTSFVSDWLTGASTVVPTTAAGASAFGAINVINSQLLASGAAGFQAGVSSLTSTLGNIFNQSFGTTLSGVQAGLTQLVSGAATFVFAGIAQGASALAAATTGVPILGTATAAIASGASTFAAYIASAGPLVQVVAVVAAAYVAVKVVKVIWKGIKKLFSDERMKTNVKFVRKMPNGLNLYQYEYRKEFKDIAGHGVFEGYMAHEVEKRYPKAVQIESNGYKSVNYSLVGI